MREMPRNIEAEERLLSCCIMGGDEVVARAQVAGITPLSFYETRHQTVFGAFIDLVADQKPIDAATLATCLTIRKQLDSMGGYPFIIQITHATSTTAQAGFFIEVVRDLAALREIIRAATSAVEECYNYSGAFEAIDQALERAIRARGNHAEPRNWRDAVKEAEALTRERMKPPQLRNLNGAEISWGIPDFDRFFQPLEPGELVVVGGYTSAGKSSLLRGILWGIANTGHPAFINTLEVRDTEEAINLASHISGVRGRARLHELHEQDQNDLIAAFGAMKIAPFAVCHQDNNITAICARARAFKRKYGLAVFGIDYLQILEDVKKLRPNERPDFAIGCVTSELKRFATTEGTVNFLLSGFNREYIRDRREPRLSDLDGSSAIEKDASRVLLIHIPEEYHVGGAKMTQSLTADSSDQPRFFVKIIQAKGRNQGTSSVAMMFNRATKTFHQISK